MWKEKQMANVQKQFEGYHAAIRMDYDMDATLREKRDIILDKLAAGLAAAGKPAFRRLLQGSYQMKTGDKPLRGEPFDMDVGLRFDFTDTDHAAVNVRQWILDIIDGHTKTGVESKGPCIRVSYAEGFHIDLVVYATWEDSAGRRQYRLAHRDRGWVPADPQRLLDYVVDAAARFRGSEGSTQIDQLRRAIRYLKRWDDVWVPDGTDGKLSGLAFTLMAIQNLRAAVLSWDGKPDDCAALLQLANWAANNLGRITASKPTPEYEDLFGALDDAQMSALKERFDRLAAALDAATTATDPVKACEVLSEVLGTDFPVPEQEETAVKTGAPAIITSSSSA
jgi:hypothetical protein